MSIFAAPTFYNQRDQGIYNQGFFFQPQERFSDGVYTPPAATTTGGVTTLPAATTMNMGGGGGGGVPFSGTTSDLTADFMDTITDRQNRLNNPPDKFFGFDTMRDQQLTGADAGFYIGSGTDIPQEQTFAGKVQDFLTPQSADQIIAEGYQEPSFRPGIISAILGKVDRYGTLPRGDQAFIARNMGYTGPTVFGENASGLGKDPFGLNVRSGFGNYAERVGKEYSSLGDSLSGRLADKYGVEFDEETGMFVGKNAARANQMTKMMRAKYNFYKQQTAQRDADRKAAREAELAAQRKRAEALRDKTTGEITAGAETGSGGREVATDAGSVAGAQQDISNYESFGEVPMADGGRVPYMMGGLTNLVDIYD